MNILPKTLARVLQNRKYYTFYYKSAINKYTHFNSYLQVFNDMKTLKTQVLTDQKIVFLEDIPLGTTLNYVKDRFYGSYRIVNKLKNVTILLSEIKLYDFKFSLEMHFFREKLVFFKYTFKKKSQKKMLIDLIKKKYRVEDLKNDFYNYFCIADGKNNYITIEDNVNLSINYITYNFGFFEYLKDLKEEEFLLANRRELAINELINKL